MYCKKRIFIVFLFAITSVFGSGALPYVVDFEGVNDSSTLKLLKAHCELIALKDKPPASMQALKYRAENDIPQLIKTLHTLGYYEASVHAQIEVGTNNTPTVIIHVDLGPLYRFENFTLNFSSDVTLNEKILGIELNDPAESQKVLDAENLLLKMLSEEGYPLAKISERTVIVDGKSHGVKVHFAVDCGSLCRFGSLSIFGNTHIRDRVIENKILWKKGQKYSQKLVDETQRALLDTGLFSTVEISFESTLTEEGLLPIKIQVTESKFRSISLGASYQTHWGLGGNLSWENRNVSGKGRKLHLEADVTQKSHTGIASYTVPDFKKVGQDMIWQAEADNASVEPSFVSNSYSLTWRLDRKFSKRFSASLGAAAEKLYVRHSVDNGEFWLVAAPFYVRYNTTNSLLNPTKGFKAHYHAQPALNLTEKAKPFIYQEAKLCTYWPLYKDSIVLAQLFTLGSILSDTYNSIPVPERLFGGTEDTLRGYTFMTVSPLNPYGKPIGGRGALYYTFEMRFRLSKSFGLVPFYDMGRVTKFPLPNVTGHWLKSVGIGIRYFTFFGPFRLDVGFPLDRRYKIDYKFRILASIGQSF